MVVQRVRNYYYRMEGYDLHKSTRMERGLNLDRLNPRGVHIGENSEIASGVTILSHRYRFVRSFGERFVWVNMDTYIGDNCVIGVGAIILGGVRIGNEVVVAAGSVVTEDVPSKSIVAGNPARVIESEIDIYQVLILRESKK